MPRDISKVRSRKVTCEASCRATRASSSMDVPVSVTGVIFCQPFSGQRESSADLPLMNSSRALMTVRPIRPASAKLTEVGDALRFEIDLKKLVAHVRTEAIEDGLIGDF